MSEESKETTTSLESKGTDGNSEEGDKPQATDWLAQADSKAERLEAANKEGEKILREMQEIYSRMRLGGQSAAGAKPQTDDDKIDEKVKAFIDNYT